MIDEVRLYNLALTGTEVSSIYNYSGSSTLQADGARKCDGNGGLRHPDQTGTWSASMDSVTLAGYQVFPEWNVVGNDTEAFVHRYGPDPLHYVQLHCGGL